MTSYLGQFRRFLQDGRDNLVPGGDAVASVAAVDMLLHNWHLGITSFGGSTKHFRTFYRLFVEKYNWIDDQTYQEMFGLCQALPGSGSTKMHYGVNLLHYGVGSGLLAFLVWSLPMAIAAFGLSVGVASMDQQLPASVCALLSGLNSATIGIIALAAVQLANNVVTDKLTRILVFVGATAGMMYSRIWLYPALMAAGGLLAAIHDLRIFQKAYRKLHGQRKRRDTETDSSSVALDGLNRSSTASGVEQPDLRRQNSFKQMQGDTLPTATHEAQHEIANSDSMVSSWKISLLVLILFVFTSILIMAVRGSGSYSGRAFDLFVNLYLAGTVAFGGGPVMIPLLFEYVVMEGWASSRDFLLGLAIMQAFPGPDFNFAVFLGSLAVTGTNFPRAVGAVMAYLAIYVPGLWLHTGLIGQWSAVRKIHAVRACLRGIHATAAGLVFAAVFHLFQLGYVDVDGQSGGSLAREPWWMVIAATIFVGGMHFNLSSPLAVVLGAVLGLVWYRFIST